MMFRRIILFVLGVAIVAGVVPFVSPATAQAIDFCATAPRPTPPKTGLSGLITQPPETLPAGDPFEDPTIPLHDVYGTSWRYTLYDLGCIPDPVGDSRAHFDTANATGLMDLAAFNIAFLSLLERLAKASSIDWLTGWAAKMTESIRPLILGGSTPSGVVVGLLPIAILLTAVWIAWMARRANLSKIGHHLAVLAVAFILAIWTLTVPAVASKATDSAVTAVGKAGGSAFSASLTDGVNRQSLYRAWLAGHFVDADSDLAREYGPRLMAATKYTWAEWQQIQDNPDAREGIDEDKAEDFKELAGEIKENHPAVYETFQGHGQRFGPALYANGVAIVMSLFAAVALLIILVSRFMMQALVIIAPVGAILGVLPRGEQSLWAMWNLFFASLWNVFKFSLAAGLMAVIMGQLQTLDPVSAVVWMIVVTVAAFVVLKPFRSFKTMIPGADPNRSYLMDLGKLVGKLAVAGATGGAAGAAMGAATVAQAGSKDQPETAGAPTRVELRTPAPLPAPEFQQIPETTRKVQAEAPPPNPRRQLGAGAPRWEGVAPVKPQPVAPVPPALPAGESRDVTLRMDKPIVVTTPEPRDSARAVEGSGRVEQTRVVITGEVVNDTGQYTPVRAATQSRIESLAAPRPTREPREVVIYQPSRSTA